MIRSLNGTLPSLAAMRKKFDEDVDKTTERLAVEGLAEDKRLEKEHLPEKGKFSKIRKALGNK